MNHVLTSAPCALAEQFENDGFLVIRGLLNPEEVQEIRDRFKEIHNDGAGLPGKYEPANNKEAIDKPNDPLNKYPRVIQPHRFDEVSRRYLLHPRLRDVLVDLLGQEPMAVQSMFYFKPPGSRGQEMHQDQFYLTVEPGTCVAAWIAIDKCDAENGAMMIVPRTRRGRFRQIVHQALRQAAGRQKARPAGNGAGRRPVLQRLGHPRFRPESVQGPFSALVHLPLRHGQRRAHQQVVQALFEL
jgi:ectoine hydroxylase-related dioxygenase (phytanoyl-CoA dioxygenase family)